jgi:hypothetical protein
VLGVNSRGGGNLPRLVTGGCSREDGCLWTSASPLCGQRHEQVGCRWNEVAFDLCVCESVINDTDADVSGIDHELKNNHGTQKSNFQLKKSSASDKKKVKVLYILILY